MRPRFENDAITRKKFCRLTKCKTMIDDMVPVQ